MFSQFANLGENLVEMIFHLIILGVAVYSILAVYALLKYGRSKILSLAVTLTYFFIVFTIYSSALWVLAKINF